MKLTRILLKYDGQDLMECAFVAAFVSIISELVIASVGAAANEHYKRSRTSFSRSVSGPSA